jgi:hypothetical protein
MINPQWGFNPIIIRMLFAVTLFQKPPQSPHVTDPGNPWSEGLVGMRRNNTPPSQ